MDPKIVAEIGCNHKGDMEIAKEMIITAINFCKVDVVKFQKRNPRELLTEKEYNASHEFPQHSYGRTYGEHREFLEFSIDEHKELKELVEKMGAIYSSSVWDVTSAREITSLKPQMIKIPSACNDNEKLLLYIADNFPGDIHISLGITTLREEECLIKLFDKEKRLKDIVLYSCTSAYPVKFEDVCLMEIERLQRNYGSKIKAIGFSGHCLGIATDIAALVLDAKWFERHFTLDRTWKGTDHAASLEPIGLMKLVRDLHNVKKTLRYKKQEILEVEKEQRAKLKWGTKKERQ